MLNSIILLLLIAPAPTANVDSPHGTLTFTVTDYEGTLIPAKLSFTDLDGKKSDMFPNADADPTKLAVRYHAI